MRKNFGPRPLIYPMPVLIIGSYDKDGTPNAMNAAWGGISERSEISICVGDNHKTTENILARKAFTVSIADVDNLIAADYVGIVSANNVPDKIAKVGWHTSKSDLVDAPLFEELPFCLECKLKSYDKESCRMVGEIVNVCADERILDKNGKIDLLKFRPITYNPDANTYVALGATVGKAFSDGKNIK